jgi:hypothetical protein
MPRTQEDAQKDFLIAFEDLRDNLLHYLLESRSRNPNAWSPYWELNALIGRIRNGEEKITNIAS